MAELLIPKTYKVAKDFPVEVTLELSPREWLSTIPVDGDPPIYPPGALVRRQFVATQECTGSIRGQNITLPAGKELFDTRQALTFARQNKPISSRDTLRLEAGMRLPFAVGNALHQSYPDYVEEVQEDPLALAEEEAQEKDPLTVARALVAGKGSGGKGSGNKKAEQPE